MKPALILAALAASMLAACSSTPPRTDAVKVEDAFARPAPPAPAAPTEVPAAVAPPAAPAAAQTIAPAQPLQGAPVADGPFPPKGLGGALGQRTLYYGFDVFAVPEDGKPVVTAHAAFLGKHPQARMVVQGNCDERGSREYNLALGMRRAEGVKSLLTLSGAAGEQVEAVSFGKEKPADAGHDEAAWAKNRRVDLVYQGE